MQESLRKEADAIYKIADNMDGSFVSFVEKLASCKGKLVFTGVGKSFQISQKIASSFSSVGITAVSIDPLSFLHGELGLLAEDDMLVVLSNSGETDILITLVKYVKSLNIDIVSILGRYNSSLERYSVCNIIAETDETGPFGLVPSVSTTVMMVIGDALLSAIVEMKNLTINDFKRNHPGGTIGKKMRDNTIFQTC